MANVAFGVDIKDERSIRVPIPTDCATTEQFGKFLVNAGQDGYVLKSASTIEGGSQRDPYTVGVEITVAR